MIIALWMAPLVDVGVHARVHHQKTQKLQEHKYTTLHGYHDKVNTDRLNMFGAGFKDLEKPCEI